MHFAADRRMFLSWKQHATKKTQTCKQYTSQKELDKKIN